jgi:CRP-like cAMP-binding protein
LVLAYVHASASQIAQTAACNRLHFLEQRCCRWLLIAADNARSTTFSLTQEFLAMMLGVHRPGLSVALKRFQDAGMIDYSRGHMTISDRAGIEAAACECYRTICDEFDRLFASRGRK